MLNPKSEARNPKQIQIYQIQNSKHYNLEERTYNFAKRVIQYAGTLSKTLANIEIAKQLIRSAGSVGANYIEANEALSKKDFLMRIKISRKEAKESCYWLMLTEPAPGYQRDKETLIQEATELMKIFGAIFHKSQ